MLFPVLWEEPFGLVAVEAMACGTPVVAFHGGAATETVRPAVSGYLCRSVNELVKYARQVPSHLNPKTVRQYVEQHFSAERMAQDYMDLYEQLLRRQTSESKAVVALNSKAA